MKTIDSNLCLHEELVEGVEVAVAGAQEALLVEEVGDVGGADGGRGRDGQQEVTVAGLGNFGGVIGEISGRTLPGRKVVGWLTRTETMKWRKASRISRSSCISARFILNSKSMAPSSCAFGVRRLHFLLSTTNYAELQSEVKLPRRLVSFLPEWQFNK